MAILAGVTGGVVDHQLQPAKPTSATTAAAPTATQLASTGAGTLNVPAVVAAVEPSVVEITANTGQGTAIGTGFIISADGQIVTNAHVVAGANQVNVRLNGQTTAHAAQVVSADPNADIALLKVSGVNNLQPVKLGSPATAQVGNPVVAIGYALGLHGQPTVTTGIISGTNRTLDQLTGLLQTDAPINPGNSGGPLVDATGAVVGIDTAKLSGNGSSPLGGGQPGYENIGFAIPIQDAMKVVSQLQNGGRPTSNAQPGYLGISVSDTTDGTLGALVQAVASGSPAASAGLQTGDVIVALDGRPIDGQANLSQAISQTHPGDNVTLTVTRGSGQQQVRVSLGTRTA